VPTRFGDGEPAAVITVASATAVRKKWCRICVPFDVRADQPEPCGGERGLGNGNSGRRDCVPCAIRGFRVGANGLRQVEDKQNETLLDLSRQILSI
jgi:hypothetical protein